MCYAAHAVAGARRVPNSSLATASSFLRNHSSRRYMHRVPLDLSTTAGLQAGGVGHRLAAEWVWERAACGDGYTAATRLVRCVCREPSRSGLLDGLSTRVSIYQAFYLTSEPVCRCAPMMSELYLR